MAVSQHHGDEAHSDPELLELDGQKVARQIVGCFGREAELVVGDSPAGQTQRRSPDIGRLRKLGFEPKIPFAEGIAPVVDWYVKNRHLKHEEGGDQERGDNAAHEGVNDREPGLRTVPTKVRNSLDSTFEAKERQWNVVFITTTSNFSPW